jgi:hypothetical protein
VLSITAVAVALAVQPVQAQEATSAAASSDPAALAVLPIAEADRATAKILGYEDGTLVVLREGTGAFICIADNPDDERFQVLCYHKSLEPYMARGRELRAEGITGKPGIEKRWEEIDAGELEMPRHPATLHQLFGSDPAAVTLENADSLGRLTVIYMAYATVEETGLLGQPSRGKPWIMYPGKPTAHVMISGR